VPVDREVGQNCEEDGQARENQERPVGETEGSQVPQIAEDALRLIACRWKPVLDSRDAGADIDE
jgi:hypothetical protein